MLSSQFNLDAIAVLTKRLETVWCQFLLQGYMYFVFFLSNTRKNIALSSVCQPPTTLHLQSLQLISQN